MSKNPPIFVIGPPRSGTTLLAAMISSHSKIVCGPETHFFSKTSAFERKAATRDSCWPRKAVELVCNLTLSGQYVYKLFDISKKDLRKYLAQQSPSVRSMLESLTVPFATRHGKQRWAEKTPNHLLHVSEIHAAFPEAYFIRIVRDPRDVGLSMRKLPWATNSVLANSYLWHDWHQRSHEVINTVERALTVRYEDLVTEPVRILKRVCNHINVPFEKNTADAGSSASLVTTSGEPWKSRVRKNLDPSRRQRWKNEVSSHVASTVGHVCWKGMEEFGYPGASEPNTTVVFYGMNLSFIEERENIYLDILQNGILIDHIARNEIDIKDNLPNIKEKAVWGSVPEIGHTLFSRIKNVLYFSAKIIKHTVCNGRLRVSKDLLCKCKTRGKLGKVIKTLLLYCGNQVTIHDILDIHKGVKR